MSDPDLEDIIEIIEVVDTDRSSTRSRSSRLQKAKLSLCRQEKLDLQDVDCSNVTENADIESGVDTSRSGVSQLSTGRSGDPGRSISQLSDRHDEGGDEVITSTGSTVEVTRFERQRCDRKQLRRLKTKSDKNYSESQSNNASVDSIPCNDKEFTPSTSKCNSILSSIFSLSDNNRSVHSSPNKGIKPRVTSPSICADATSVSHIFEASDSILGNRASRLLAPGKGLIPEGDEEESGSDGGTRRGSSNFSSSKRRESSLSDLCKQLVSYLFEVIYLFMVSYLFMFSYLCLHISV